MAYATRVEAAVSRGIARRRSGRASLPLLVFLLVSLLGAGSVPALPQVVANAWRAATERELQALLPARATVEKEHIETEMRTASGITDGRGRFVAGVVLITAGYSADGKYSHYLVAQVPVHLGSVTLPPGEYVLGWQRAAEALDVHIYDAATGSLQASVRWSRGWPMRLTTRCRSSGTIWPCCSATWECCAK